MLRKFSLLLAAGLVATAGLGHAQTQELTTLFEDAFDSDTSGDYTVLTAENDSAGSPQTITFGFDYSTLTLGGNPLPEAPNSPSGATDTSGVFTQGNTDSGGSENAFSIYIYPDMSDVTGDHRVTLDVFYLLGGPGSTEVAALGINHVGDKTINLFQDEGDGFPENPEATDGYHTQLAADFGMSTVDLNLYEGDPNNPDEPLTNADGFFWQIADADDDSTTDGDTSGLSTAIDDSGRFGSVSEVVSPNEAWFTMRLNHVDGVTTWQIDLLDGNGFIPIASYNDPDDTWTSGVPGFGHQDPFGGSQNDTSAYIWDNLVVEQITFTDAENWNLYR